MDENWLLKMKIDNRWLIDRLIDYVCLCVCVLYSMTLANIFSLQLLVSSLIHWLLGCGGSDNR